MKTSCDLCGCEDRLHRVRAREVGKDYIEDILVCDECYEELTGFIAVCVDGCSLHLAHNGECKI